jgi:hypothetical protein
MVGLETLEMIREAFDRLSDEMNLNGWGRDNMGWYYQDNTTDDLTVHLLRGQSERASIIVHPGTVLFRDGAITVEGLMREIRSKLSEKGLIEATH